MRAWPRYLHRRRNDTEERAPTETSRDGCWYPAFALAVAFVNRQAGRPAKSGHHDLYRGPVVRGGAEVPEAELSTSIENEIAAHLRHVQLLGMPDLSPKGEANVGPNHPWRSDGQKAFPPEP